MVEMSKPDSLYPTALRAARERIVPLGPVLEATRRARDATSPSIPARVRVMIERDAARREALRLACERDGTQPADHVFYGLG